LLRRAVLLFLVFILTEEAIWLGVLLYAYDVGGATTVGLVAVVQLVPAMVFAPVGATFLDRMTIRTRLLVTYGTISAFVALTGVLLVLDAPAAAVLASAVLATVVITLGRPAHYGALPQLAELPSHLTAANSISGTLEALGVLLGPLTVVVALAVADVGSLFVLLGILMALGTLTLVRAPRSHYEEALGEPEPFMRSLVQGVREVRRVPGAFTLLLIVGLSFVLQGALDVLGVAFAIDVLDSGESGASSIAAANGMGLLLGALASVVLVGVARLSPVFVAGCVVGGAALAAVGLADTLMLTLVFVVMSGLARSFAEVAGRTLLHRNCDDAAMARVFGVREAILTAGLAIGAALAPIAISVVGERGAFAVIGAILAVPALLTIPVLRALDRTGVLAVERIHLLRRLTLFAPLQPPELERLAVNSTQRQVASGEVLIRQGDEGDVFYAVESGEYDVDVDGERVAQIGAGGFFGEIALLRDVPRTATVTCREDGEVLVVERDLFLTAMSAARPHER
jgi:MFS family permease